jgi:hypothetical protein
MRKPNIKRSGERLIRLAYELEALAARLRGAGEESAANGVRHISSQLGNIGRDLDQNALQPEREQLFKLVADPDDWKAPINAFIKYAWNITPEQMNDAIVHFTATEAAFTHETHGYHVTAVGYRKGPCGP